MIGRLDRWIDRTFNYPKLVERELFGYELTIKAHAHSHIGRLEGLEKKEPLLRDLLHSIEKGDIFWDIGADIGTVSILAAMQGAEVVGFEPDNEKRILAQRNAVLNDQYPFLLPYALAESVGVQGFIRRGLVGGSGRLTHSEHVDHLVSIANIDWLTSRGRLDPPNLLKMDVEGEELAALRGGELLFSKEQRPRFVYVEVHEKKGMTTDDVIHLLSDYEVTDTSRRENIVNMLFQK